MNFNNPNNSVTPPPFYGQRAVVDQTNAVLKRVYIRMFLGLLISAFCAVGVVSSPTMLNLIYGNSLVYWGMFIVMIIMAWTLPARINKMSSGTTLLLFALFSALMGCSLASIFIIYSGTSIASTFFISAGLFGVMSVYGFFTKSDLSKMGSILMMGLIGLIIAGVVNIFVASSALDWIISLVGVILFTGLTAWDTQQIKQLAAMNLEPSMADKLATIGAMNLYLDFINLFLFLLRFLGAGRD